MMVNPDVEAIFAGIAADNAECEAILARWYGSTYLQEIRNEPYWWMRLSRMLTLLSRLGHEHGMCVSRLVRCRRDAPLMAKYNQALNEVERVQEYWAGEILKEYEESNDGEQP